MREAERRGLDKSKGKAGREMDFQDDDDDDDEDNQHREDNAAKGTKPATTQDNNNDEEENYYQLITSETSAKKAAKISQQAQQSAPFASFIEDPSTTDPSTKRAITYEISANKGLMPRRKKEVRNPRVKKRMKYDEKMKKLGSVRQVWKGGEGRGGYGGELTGIKTNVVRSVKL